MRIQYTHNLKHTEVTMSHNYNLEAPKKATNLSINSDLLKQAREFKINLSSAFEKALAELVKQRQEEQWLKSNQKAINTYNKFVDDNGVFSKNSRSF